MSTHLTTAATPTPRIDPAAAALWASAFILAALVLVQAARLVWPLGAPAHADVVAEVAGHTALTFNSGNDDVLAVLDSRGEQLYTYRIQNQSRVELLRSYDVRDLFDIGRRLGAGRK